MLDMGPVRPGAEILMTTERLREEFQPFSLNFMAVQIADELASDQTNSKNLAVFVQIYKELKDTWNA